MSANDHGSASTYSNHGCRCIPCREANSRRIQAQRLARHAGEIPAAIAHGSASAYTNWGCRCDDCRAAKTAYDRRRNLARRTASRATNNVPAATSLGGRQRPGTPGGASPSATPPQSPRAGFVADGTSARPGVRAWAGRDAKS